MNDLEVTEVTENFKYPAVTSAAEDKTCKFQNILYQSLSLQMGKIETAHYRI